MAINSATINLSELPPPDVVVLPDPTLIFADWLARLRALDPAYNALLESDPVFKQGEVLTYQITLLRQAMNDAVRAVLLSSAYGADLDQIGGNFDVPRLLISPGDPDAVPPVDPVWEGDEPYRTRIQMSWARLSTAGAENAYTFFAASADPSILDVRAYGPEDHSLLGEVYVYVLSRIGQGIPSSGVLTKVYDAVNQKEVRPVTDFVTVKPAIIVPFTVNAVIQIPYGPDTDTVVESCRTAVTQYVADLHKLGCLVPRSGIFHALHQPGVVKVTLTSPATDIEMKMGEAPYCTAITLTKDIINGE